MKNGNQSRTPQRFMSVVAQDPGVLQQDGKILMAKVAVPAEDLIAGPMGYRVHVVDFDTTARRYHGAHKPCATYEDEPKHWSRGDQRIVGEYAFHAQNVYALVMKTLARFEFALGRRVRWSFENHQLKVAPHGMLDANAFYSPADEGLVFGYFKGRSGKTVYTSLSHDVIVHETTHALLDALRGRYLMPSNPDQGAFHEGFADVIALLSVFALPEIVQHLLLPGRSTQPTAKLISRAACEPEALRKSALFGLAEEMGKEVGQIRGEALRRSAVLPPSRTILADPEYQEPHRRGEVFVAAVLRAFIEAWSARIFASGTKKQRSFPLARVVEEGADIADTLATLWIRAIDYMPPVHLTFSDALTAALTSDSRVRPDDTRYALRTHLKEQFEAYGIAPVTNGTNDTWRPAPEGIKYDRVRSESMRSDKDEVFRFIWENRTTLKIDASIYAKVLSVRPCLHTGIDGFLLRETVAEYYQVTRLTPRELADRKIEVPPDMLAELERAQRERSAKRNKAGADDAGLPAEGTADEEEDFVTPLYGGGVLIFDEYGQLKYHICNPIFGDRQAQRLQYLWEAGLLRVKADSTGYRGARLSTMHRMRAIDARRWPYEGW
jgi:hypothetical protein